MKNSLIDSQGDRARPLTDNYLNSPKPKLVHGESEISDHTKDLQKNLMKQVHEDVINTPNMLINDPQISSSWLDHGITEIIGVSKTKLILKEEWVLFFIKLCIYYFLIINRFLPIH